eukprot:TRINITY_DN5019_c0_g1_i1.p1 TRINITY_DN5019_c0_g1~~TRINITY_DN5019_c0_g1_i1.p1  ORF type:complete len:343 (+),score=129.36 TRINITY_DN5019_c0_g1_i1:92-1030(+)
MATGEFGMMDGAYFVSRSELLQWLNDLLGLQYSKVEQCCSGIAHVQILDALFPGTVPLHKVNFSAKLEHEYIGNLKVLQNAFIANGIKKVIEIERLVKGKYQDNLEFLQWMKRFADARMPGGLQHYDAVQAREQAIGMQRRLLGKRPERGKVPSARQRKEMQGVGADAQAAAAVERRAATPPAATTGVVHAAQPPYPQRAINPPSPARASDSLSRGAPPLEPASGGGGGGGGGGQDASAQELRQLREDLELLRQVNETLEQERDFYYNKLRDVEILCVESVTGEVSCEAVKQILYATNDGFQEPGADAQGTG